MYLALPQHNSTAVHRLRRLASPLAPAGEGEFLEEPFVVGGGVGAALLLDGEGDAGGGGDAGEGEEADYHCGGGGEVWEVGDGDGDGDGKMEVGAWGGLTTMVVLDRLRGGVSVGVLPRVGEQKISEPRP